MASDSSCNDCVWYSVHVGGIFFLSSHTSMYMPFVVFSFCYALNHQFKGKEWDMKQHLFSLGQVLHLPNAFWIQFKWLRIEEILPTITNWKISHKIYSAFIDSLSAMGGPSCLFLMYLVWIVLPDAGSGFHAVQTYSTRFCILSVPTTEWL